MRTIRRYSNRKLYDTAESRYVILADIAKLIRQGEEVQVIDKDSGRDLTASTMAQIIFEEAKSGRPFPAEGFRRIIVSGSPVG